jgi:hypothetical protein
MCLVVWVESGSARPAARAESVVEHSGQALVNLFLLLIQMDGRSTSSNSRSIQDVVQELLIQQELGKLETRQER